MKKLGQEGSDLGETSEIAVRLMNYFAGLRSGLDPRTAAAVSAESNVQYSRVTSFEKKYLKRAFTYYTFPRKFIPYAWRRFAEDPSQASVMAHSLIGALEDGVAVDTSGQVKLRIGDEGRFRYNIQRSHAGVDAMFALPALANYLVPGKLPGEEITGTGARPAFATWGPVAKTAWGAAAERRTTDPTVLEDSVNLLPHLRWAIEDMGPGDPEKLTTAFEKYVGDRIFGVQKQRINHEQRIYRSRYNTVYAQLKQEIQDATFQGFTAKAADLRNELQRLASTYQQKLDILND